MKPLTVERYSDVAAFALALDKVYPSYIHKPYKPKGARRWRIGIYCRATDSLLTFYKP